MNDRAVGLLEQYEVEVRKTAKGRGTILCDTDIGPLVLKEYGGNEGKIRAQSECLQQLGRLGRTAVEQIIPTKEGDLLVKDTDGVSYVLKSRADGRECNIYERAECLEAMRILAELHLVLEQLPLIREIPASSPAAEYEKHNRELNRVRRFLRRKGQKSWFEVSLQSCFEFYLEQALEVTRQWQQYSYLSEGQPERECICHGDYQYHNLIRTDEGWCVVNFDKMIRDNPVRDLCLLMRKLMEKSNWSIAFGQELLTAYERVRPLSAYSRIDLYYRLAYPEKFWKIVNHYYNTGKAWIPEKNMEKLEKLHLQEERKQDFLDNVFRV